MSRRIPFTIGDTEALLDVVIRQRYTPAALDISAMTVVLRFSAEPEGDPTDISGTLLAGRVLDNGTVDTFDDTAGKYGRVRFNMATVLSSDPGYYEGEIRLTDSNYHTQTIDERLKFTLREGL